MGEIGLEGLPPVARDHATNPRNYGPLDQFDGHARVTGLRGDTMEFWVAVRDESMERVSFITDGCRASRACGSMVSSMVAGRHIDDALNLKEKDILDALGGLSSESEHCALLAANALKVACQDFLNRRAKPRQQSPSAGGTCDSCGDKKCTAAKRKDGESDEEFQDRRRLQSRLCRIRYKVAVLSGKGGVGKSTVAVNLAMSLSMSGKRVGLLDVDIHGPSIPTMLDLEQERPQGCEEGLLPVDRGGMKIMSLGFLLRSQDDAVIWRGPMKSGVIKQFLQDVVWGDLDYLIIDFPPGTGDEPLSVCQLVGRLDGAVVVTTPQRVAAVDVRKSITFCRHLNVPVLGVVENMSGFVCPKCGEVTPIFRSGGGWRIAEDMRVPFLGSIPMDPKIAEAADSGRAFVDFYASTPTAEIMRTIVKPIAALDGTAAGEGAAAAADTGPKRLRIVIPLANGKLTPHFGHCERFAIVDVNPARKKILQRKDIGAPPHQPGLLPSWLAERGVNMIIAGGMGQRAQDLCREAGIEVLVGAPAATPEMLVSEYLAGTLRPGENACDH